MAETNKPSHIEQIFREVWEKHRADIIAQSGGKTTEEWDEKELPELVRLLNRHFSEEELRTFAFELGEDYDNLPAQGKEAKTRELVTKFFRHGRLTEMVEHAKAVRQHVSWDTEAHHTVKRLEQVDWAEAARNYTEFIKSTYGTMHVFGQPAPVPLEGIFTDVYILDIPAALQRFSPEELQTHYVRGEPFEHRSKRQAGLDVIRQVPKLFILGKPGAGKTTFLRYLALQAARGHLFEVPVFISLKELADSGQQMIPFIAAQFAVCDWPNPQLFIERLLSAGQVLLLLDGLDEVSEAQAGRSHLITVLQHLAKTYAKCQFIMTCRVAATDYIFEKFTYGEMADFAPAQVATFVQKWFVTDVEKGKNFLNELKKREHEGLRELAQTPLLLALLCLAFAENFTFPQRRVEIYEEAIDALLKKWDASRNIRRDEAYRRLSLGRKRQMLASIAHDTFHKGNYFIPKTELARWIEKYLQGIPGSSPDGVDGEAILQAVEAQHGILIERARGIYSFAHLTFQEYFTARHVVENYDKKVLNLMPYIADRRWREVFLLTASLLDDASHFFALLMKILERMMADSDNIMGLLFWANQKAKGENLQTNRLVDRRVFYLLLDRVLARALVLDRTFAIVLDSAFALTYALNTTLTDDFSLNSTLIHSLVYTPDRDRAFDNDNTLAHAPCYTINIDQDLVLDFTLTFALLLAEAHVVGQVFEKAVTLSQELKLLELTNALTSLKPPHKQESDKQWRQFCTALHRILQTHRQLGREWAFTREEGNRLASYLIGNELLVQCLKLAYVSDRQAIEDRLLLPPGVKDEKRRVKDE